ncbi:MAG: VOC family protein [Nitriliruptorales bacterium]|nr:VOC family protein [Nitriliruptorales bacterium]
MAVRLGWWVIDTLDGERLADFYETLLGWPRLFTSDEGIALVPSMPPVLGQGFLLYTEHGTGEKTFKNRAHPDFRPPDAGAMVERALELGATNADIGQGPVDWSVFTDPEGNEFCVLSSGDVDQPEIDAFTLDSNDLDVLAPFWSSLLGWDEVARDHDSVRLRDPSGDAHDLLLLESPDEKAGKNRVHPDLIPVADPDDPEAREREASRVLELGGSHADIGQGDVPWSVMADPEGNEFCILSPRAAGPPPE